MAGVMAGRCLQRWRGGWLGFENTPSPEGIGLAHSAGNLLHPDYPERVEGLPFFLRPHSTARSKGQPFDKLRESGERKDDAEFQRPSLVARYSTVTLFAKLRG